MDNEKQQPKVSQEEIENLFEESVPIKIGNDIERILYSVEDIFSYKKEISIKKD